MQTIRDPIGGALTIAFNSRVSGDKGTHTLWTGGHSKRELADSKGMHAIRATVPSGAVALIINFYSDKSDINAT